jgi:transposase
MSQITVLTGDRRRTWSDEQKLSILQEAFGSEATPAEVARRHDISTGLLYTWRRKALAPASSTEFIEAVMDDAPPARPGSSEQTVIHVELSGARVGITGSASPALVSAVLKALR